MAFTVTSPPYSFLTVTTPALFPGCVDEGEMCYPVLNITELEFQVFVDTDSAVSLGTVTINIGADVVGTFDWYEYDTDQYVGQVNWAEDAQDIFEEDVNTGDCFGLNIQWVYSGLNDTIDIRNCLVRVADECFTTVLTYYNKCSAMGFKYQFGVLPVPLLTNKIRLRMMLAFPKYPEKRTVYRKSTGVIKETSSIMLRQWTFKSDDFTEYQHLCFAIAMKHQTITATDERGITHTIRLPEGESVEPKWNEDPGIQHRLAQIEVKVIENLLHSISIFCGATCTEEELTPVE